MPGDKFCINQSKQHPTCFFCTVFFTRYLLLIIFLSKNNNNNIKSVVEWWEVFVFGQKNGEKRAMSGILGYLIKPSPYTIRREPIAAVQIRRDF